MAEGEVDHPAAHVIARRMALAAGCGGLTTATCGLALLVVTNDGALRGGASKVLLVAALFASASGAWCALLTLAEAAALRVRLAARLPVLALIGTGAAAAMALAYVSVASLAAGGGSATALRFADLLIDTALGAPIVTLTITTAALAPFLAIGAARTLPVGGIGPPWPLRLELVLTVVAGLLASVLVVYPPTFWAHLSLVLLSVSMSVGLRVADRVEAAVRYGLARSRSEEESWRTRR